MAQGLRARWVELWRALDEAEQVAVMTAALTVDPAEDDEVPWRVFRDALLELLSAKLHFRRQTIETMARDRVARHLARVGPTTLGADEWHLVFTRYFETSESGRALVQRFAQLLSAGNEDADAVSDLPAPEDPASVVAALMADFGPAWTVRFIRYLVLSDPERWSCLVEHLPTVEDATASPEPELPEASATDTGSSELMAAVDAFTQLDRVLIDQVVATAAGEDGALTPDELVDLVESVHALKTSRARTYFHLGFMDTLVDGRVPTFERPEMNERRARWYLAGVLAGLARRGDVDGIRHWITERASDFDEAARVEGDAGRAIAGAVCLPLLEAGDIGAGVKLVRGQLGAMDERLRWRVLALASDRIQHGDTAAARAVLGALEERLQTISWLDDGDGAAFSARVRRKLAQAVQLGGDLTRAVALYDGLLQGDDQAGASAEVLADRGLVEAGFRSWQELRIEGPADRRARVREALARGRPWFERAVEDSAGDPSNAHFALAAVEYLTCMDDGAAGDTVRASALRHAEEALAGMLSSASAPAYREMGLVDRCSFMVAALRLKALDESLAQSALQEWRAISAGPERFPLDHLGQLLDLAEAVDEHLATQFAESIWQVRGVEALSLVAGRAWSIGSDILRDGLVDVARSERISRQDRFDLWAHLVPNAIRFGHLDLAEEGLDALECLAMEDAALAEKCLAWLADDRNWNPLWSEAEALQARYRLLMRAGRTEDAYLKLRALFFALFDSAPAETAAVKRLLREHGASAELYQDLPSPVEDDSADEEAKDLHEQLKAGAPVRVLFVGGNETQARYDADITKTLAERYSGVKVTFEHTGWSSNWGRDLDRLVALAAEHDAVVLMTMMRTMLGRRLRAALDEPKRPWVSCTGRGRKALLDSIMRAAVVGLRLAQDDSGR